MLKVEDHRHFRKDLKKLPRYVHDAFQVRLLEFLENPRNPLLYDHPLKGSLQQFRSFSVTGDIRVIYHYLEADKIQLLRIGSHSQLY